jgi:hypothetical protein
MFRDEEVALERGSFNEWDPKIKSELLSLLGPNGDTEPHASAMRDPAIRGPLTELKELCEALPHKSSFIELAMTSRILDLP